jgi:anti-sigma B factor antagonist
MNVQVEEKGETTIVHLRGDLDIGNSDRARKEILSLLEAGDKKRFIIDLSQVRYVDSTGVATLVNALKVSRDKHVELALAGVNGTVKEVLGLSRLIKIFDIIDGERSEPK